jgi:hypothetical protein
MTTLHALTDVEKKLFPHLKFKNDEEKWQHIQEVKRRKYVQNLGVRTRPIHDWLTYVLPDPKLR